MQTGSFAPKRGKAASKAEKELAPRDINRRLAALAAKHGRRVAPTQESISGPKTLKAMQDALVRDAMFPTEVGLMPDRLKAWADGDGTTPSRKRKRDEDGDEDDALGEEQAEADAKGILEFRKRVRMHANNVGVATVDEASGADLFDAALDFADAVDAADSLPDITALRAAVEPVSGLLRKRLARAGSPVSDSKSRNTKQPDSTPSSTEQRKSNHAVEPSGPATRIQNGRGERLSGSGCLSMSSTPRRKPSTTPPNAHAFACSVRLHEKQQKSSPAATAAWNGQRPAAVTTYEWRAKTMPGVKAGVGILGRSYSPLTPPRKPPTKATGTFSPKCDATDRRCFFAEAAAHEPSW